MKMEAEVKVMLLHPREAQELPANPEKLGKSLQTEPTLPTPGSWPSFLQNCARINLCCLSCPVWGTLFHQL